jgi:SAM-dependent methyltransferase
VIAHTGTRTGDAARHFELRGRPLACTSLIDVRRKDLLDVGCSFGWFARHAIDAGARTVVGLDVSVSSVAIATSTVPHASFAVGSALELPFDQESFDAVTFFDVLEHLPRGSEVRALQELRRVLRPRGTLALSTPNNQWFAKLSDPAFYFGHRHYCPENVTTFLSRAGFIVNDVVVRGGAFVQLDMLLYYASRHLLRRERHPVDWIRRRADQEWERPGGSNTIFVVATRPSPES